MSLATISVGRNFFIESDKLKVETNFSAFSNSVSRSKSLPSYKENFIPLKDN